VLLELGHNRGFLAGSRGPFRYNLRMMPFRASVGLVSPGAFGIVDEFPYWNSVFELYADDNLKEATALMDQIGVGMYADYATPGDFIYLEAATSEDSEIIRIDDSLEVEVIQEQLPFTFDALAEQVRSAYKHVRSQFGSRAPASATLLTLVVQDAVIPTAAFRDGYITFKKMYGKICLPMPQDLSQIARGFRRGLIYQYGMELSAAQADLWLLEAATSITEDGGLESPGAWLDPQPLDRALLEESDTREGFARLAAGRWQCRQIAEFLLQKGGSGNLVSCLAEHAKKSSFPGFGTITSRAMKATYGFSLDRLFGEDRDASLRS
jgi:hypothetical protein